MLGRWESRAYLQYVKLPRASIVTEVCCLLCVILMLCLILSVWKFEGSRARGIEPGALPKGGGFRLVLLPLISAPPPCVQKGRGLVLHDCQNPTPRDSGYMFIRVLGQGWI